MQKSIKTLLAIGSINLVALASVINAPSLAFGIFPIKVYFQKGQPSRDVTLDNPEDKTVRLKVYAYKWEEDGEGKKNLTPTKDISLFPAILELKPKSKRIIRLASKLPPKQFEQSYRLFVEQLPETVTKKSEPTADGTQPTKTQVQLNFLYTLSLPVFISPISANRKSVISGLNISGNKLSLKLANQGNTHVFASKIEIITKDAAGKVIATKKVDPTYVLPSIERNLSMELPQEQCQNVKNISIDIQGDEDIGDKTKIDRTIPAPAGVCGAKK